MPLPIIICDDSSFARKQMARALPKDWDVDITFATNGLEAVEAVRAGKGDILFLDLTMPVLDGFGALDMIRQEDLPTMVIVVSGDVQKDAYNRVMSLGAIDFIKKPVDLDKLADVLDKYGILQELLENNNSPSARAEEFDSETVDLTDWISEISNMAMGQTADLLAQLLKIFVHLSVPNVRLLTANELRMVLASLDDAEDHHPVVCQGFIGGKISGENILHLKDIGMQDLRKLIDSDTAADGEVELVMDVANILIGAFLKSITSLLDLNFSQGQPTLLDEHDLQASLMQDNERALTIELNYTFDDYEFSCNQLIMFTEDSLKTLNTYARYASG